ncbi:glycosyl transferases group 1 [mine drainage metagenome]|uniref:Glycosyl transferases group 1 n=1 Tax=mine drainage metagenome TaxID=410659 RepID=A0A1J5RHP3_9ZZZZ
MKPVHDRVRLYHQARTAHLERGLAGRQTTLLYESRRYDFDTALADQVDARQVGALAAARLLWSSAVEVVEITEPAYLPGVRRAFVALLTVRVKGLLRRGRRPVVATYAIGNSDPRREFTPHGVKQHLSSWLNWQLSRRTMRWVDRIAFGTPAAEDLYRFLYGVPRRRQEQRLVPALPTPCTCDPTAQKVPGSVAYVGAFVERKGLRLLVDAWPDVTQHVPHATLALVGKGPLLAVAQALAAHDPQVRTVEDPPRSDIHAVLSRASVLVLASQPTPRWREQVGLPIVEGLQHGCTVVTTDETGLAPWLRAQGHTVIPGSSDAGTLAKHLIAAIRAPLPPASVLSSLPRDDGRLVADEWLLRDR